MALDQRSCQRSLPCHPTATRPDVRRYVSLCDRHGRPLRRLSLVSIVLLGTACGGGGSPTTPPTTTPPPTYSVTATVFYDEDGNGLLGAQEHTRVRASRS